MCVCVIEVPLRACVIEVPLRACVIEVPLRVCVIEVPLRVCVIEVPLRDSSVCRVSAPAAAGARTPSARAPSRPVRSRTRSETATEQWRHLSDYMVIKTQKNCERQCNY